MKTSTTIFALVLTLLSGISLAQTSVDDGDWETGTTWSSGTGLPLTGLRNQDITISTGDTVQVGSFGNDVNMLFTNDGDGQALTVESDAVLVVYGDVDFSNLAMDLVIDGTMIILGDLTFGNKMDIASDGVLVVSGTFTKEGSTTQGSYEGSGAIYAGAYDLPGGPPGDEWVPSGQDKDVSELSGDGYDDIADFIDSGGSDELLPITLGQFTAETRTNSVELNWTTLSEENFEYFEIQRAGENMEFETIATVKGNGNSKVAIDYSWTDENPNLGMNYYRLVSNDFDGYREIFKAEYVLFESSFNALAIYPNPADAYSTIHIEGSSKNDVLVNIYNMKGQLAKSLTTDSDQFELNGSIEKGMYVVELTTNGLTKKQRLIIR